MRGFGLFRNLFKGEVKEPSERRQDSRVDAREGLRILIVDDSATVVAVLGRMLTQAKYDAYATDSGEAALESLNTRIPELIFLDIVLPGMSGFAALRALRRDPSGGFWPACSSGSADIKIKSFRAVAAEASTPATPVGAAEAFFAAIRRAGPDLPAVPVPPRPGSRAFAP